MNPQNYFVSNFKNHYTVKSFLRLNFIPEALNKIILLKNADVGGQILLCLLFDLYAICIANKKFTQKHPVGD